PRPRGAAHGLRGHPLRLHPRAPARPPRARAPRLPRLPLPLGGGGRGGHPPRPPRRPPPGGRPPLRPVRHRAGGPQEAARGREDVAFGARPRPGRAGPVPHPPGRPARAGQPQAGQPRRGPLPQLPADPDVRGRDAARAPGGGPVPGAVHRRRWRRPGRRAGAGLVPHPLRRLVPDVAGGGWRDAGGHLRGGGHLGQGARRLRARARRRGAAGLHHVPLLARVRGGVLALLLLRPGQPGRRPRPGDPLRRPVEGGPLRRARRRRHRQPPPRHRPAQVARAGRAVGRRAPDDPRAEAGARPGRDHEPGEAAAMSDLYEQLRDSLGPRYEAKDGAARCSPRSERELLLVLKLVRDHGGKLGRPGPDGAPCITLSRRALQLLGPWDDASGTVLAEAGATLEEIDRAAASRQLTVGPTSPRAFALELGDFLEGPYGGLRSVPGGRLEPLSLAVTAVMPDGLYAASRAAPRHAAGPSLDAFFLGGGGRMGLLLRAQLRLVPRPSSSRLNT